MATVEVGVIKAELGSYISKELAVSMGTGWGGCVRGSKRRERIRGQAACNTCTSTYLTMVMATSYQTQLH